MSEKVVTLQFEGTKAEHGRVRLSTFVGKLQSLSAALKEAHRAVGEPAGKLRPYYRVSELQYASPYRIALEAVMPEGAPGEVLQAPVILMETARALASGQAVPESADSSLLRAIGGLASGAGESFEGGVLSFDGQEVRLAAELGSTVNSMLATEEQAYGSVEGRLEEINLHGGETRFRIYPLTGPKMVLCAFPPGLRESAKSGLDCWVTVYGLMHYRARDRFPCSVDVQRIEISPPEQELEHLLDLRGVARGATGDVSSEDFIRKLRDEWDGA